MVSEIQTAIQIILGMLIIFFFPLIVMALANFTVYLVEWKILNKKEEDARKRAIGYFKIFSSFISRFVADFLIKAGEYLVRIIIIIVYSAMTLSAFVATLEMWNRFQYTFYGYYLVLAGILFISLFILGGFPPKDEDESDVMQKAYNKMESDLKKLEGKEVPNHIQELSKELKLPVEMLEDLRERFIRLEQAK